MERAPVDGIELEFELTGSGEPVVLVHAGVCADFFLPLVEHLTGFQLLRCHRSGYAHSDRAPGAMTFAQQAAHCRALMRHAGIERAHVVGHSSSASMALQLALDAPDAVRSLGLLEPARPAMPGTRHTEMIATVLKPALERLPRGRPSGRRRHLDARGLRTGLRGALERALPGAFEQAVADADTFFGQELPAVQAWEFGPEEAARVTPARPPRHRRAQRRGVPRSRRRPAGLAAQHRDVRASGRDAPTAGREPGRARGRAGRLLLAPLNDAPVPVVAWRIASLSLSRRSSSVG